MPNEGEVGPVQLPKGRIIAKQWKIVGKLGEGGCGAVYKVQNTKNPTAFAAMKAESNFVSGGSVLKLEVMILRRLAGRPHVAQLLQSGKKDKFCYMVMTLLGDSLNNITKKLNRQFSVSTQTRVGINTLYGIKQLHDIGFIHRDLKPANIAIGWQGTNEARFLHILDFGLAREYVKKDEGALKMRRPRTRALFRGTTRYCSIAMHERKDQGRVDDMWSLLYMLAEMRGTLPWHTGSSKDEIMEIKKATEPDMMLENSPVQLVELAKHLSELDYYSRPDYALMNSLFVDVMICGQFKWTDPWDWEKKSGGGALLYLREKTRSMQVVTVQPSKELLNQTYSQEAITQPLSVSDPAMGRQGGTPRKDIYCWDPENPFPAELFARDENDKGTVPF